MPRLQYSERFADDLASITSRKLEARVLSVLDDIELFGGFGSPGVPDSIKDTYGAGVRKVALDPFDLIYTFYPESDSARIEALIHQRAVF